MTYSGPLASKKLLTRSSTDSCLGCVDSPSVVSASSAPPTGVVDPRIQGGRISRATTSARPSKDRLAGDGGLAALPPLAYELYSFTTMSKREPMAPADAHALWMR